ncbi:MAG: diaminopimelate decarboxylase [Candidatus Omnitrophota bacterium]
MHDFKYKNNDLYCESKKISSLVKAYKTPLYIYSQKTLLDHFRKLKKAFADIKPIVCYSVKANSNINILRALVREGAGLDIVSGGELYRALKVKTPPKRIVYAGVGKTAEEIALAIKNNILLFNVESLPELKLINKIAGRTGKVQRVALRINPDVKPKTHKYITTGHKENKFGIDMKEARSIFLKRKEFKNLDINGIHIHIGSQIVDVKPFIKAIKKIRSFISDLRKNNIDVKWFNIGGGLGIIYSGERPQTAEEYARKITPILKGMNVDVILEPGRFIVGNSGILAVKVLYIKKIPNKNYAIVDGAMNDLLRPSLYEAYHEVLPVRSKSYTRPRKVLSYDVVGPICESGDFLAKSRKFIDLEEGDMLAVMSSGAYGFSMSSNYNSRKRAAEVLVNGSKVRLIRKRETYKDIVRNEV